MSEKEMKFTEEEIEVLKEIVEFYNEVEGGIRIIDEESYQSILDKLGIDGYV